MELTKLQKMGISSLLMDAKHHNPFMYKGTIKFKTNHDGRFTNMFVDVTHNVELHFMFTLEESENIDTSIEYEFDYNSAYKCFTINVIKSIVGEC